MIVDLTLGGSDGIALLRDLTSRHPRIRLVTLTMHEHEETVRQAFLAGAAGYVVKGAPSADLMAAVRAVARNQHYVHPVVASVVVVDSLRWLRQADRLTPREIEVLRLLTAGRTAAETGRLLGISAHTVRRHIANVTDKAGVPRPRGADPLRPRAPPRAGGGLAAPEPCAARLDCGFHGARRPPPPARRGPIPQARPRPGRARRDRCARHTSPRGHSAEASRSRRSSSIGSAVPGVQVGQLAPGTAQAGSPELALTGIDGEPVYLADFEGRPIWVIFWKTACEPCEAEADDVAAAYAAHRGRRAGGDRRRRAGTAPRWCRTTRQGTPSRSRSPSRPGSAAMDAYGVWGAPTHYFIDRPASSGIAISAR